MIYHPFELHTHTVHSDGQFQVSELMQCCRAYGYEGMALTDHNAVSGCLEITPELEKKFLPVIRGIEWTTFFGHLLVLGSRRYVDWRFVMPDTIDEALLEIRKAGGTSLAAHPKDLGEPLMCGCRFEFNVHRWDLVSGIEIWSEQDPHAHVKNRLALSFYDQLLDQGFRLCVTAARDWHSPDDPRHIPVLTATWLGIEGPVSEQGALEAVQNGRTFVSLGPSVHMKARQQNRTFELGSTISTGPAAMVLRLPQDKPRTITQVNECEPQKLCLVMNGKTIAEKDVSEQVLTGSEFAIPFTAESGWVRAELFGRYRKDREGILAITSPIYIR